jgi:hypothetical protein
MVRKQGGQMNFTDDQRGLLTEKLLKETVYCKKCGYPIHEKTNHVSPPLFNRDFLTWQDLGDCKEALVREGLWDRFSDYSYDIYEDSGSVLGALEFGFTAWLFRPTDESGEPHFCRLAAEFIKGR